VLNALRHQRLGNRLTTPLNFEPIYVLNALRHQRLGNEQRQSAQALHNKCSTPCGINGWETSFDGERQREVVRAQRLAASTVGKLNRFSDFCNRLGKRVLNALRHQRLGNSPPIPEHDFTIYVLNALRHQRLGNTSCHNFDSSNSLCSTPCGINGWETIRKALKQVGEDSCSTPCGINGWETFVLPFRSLPDCVLNALRHQRLGNPSAEPSP